jgi:DNA-directed RNA polymerase subunit K/omega
MNPKFPVRSIHEFTGSLEGAPGSSRFLFARVASMRARQLYRQPSLSNAPARKPEAVAMEETERGLVPYSMPDALGRS